METRRNFENAAVLGSLVCPKPRRVPLHSNNNNNNNNRPSSLRFHVMSQQAEMIDSKAGSELLDIILKREGHGGPDHPYFCGSPPSRAANPLIMDTRFGDEKLVPIVPSPPISSPLGLSSPSAASARKGGCVRMKFGQTPAAVRVEGFDCLNRDRQNSSIPAMA